MQMDVNNLAWINAHRSTPNQYKTQSSHLVFKKKYFSYLRVPNTVQKLKKSLLLLLIRHSSAVVFRVSNIHQFPGFLVSTGGKIFFFVIFVVCFYT